MKQITVFTVLIFCTVFQVSAQFKLSGLPYKYDALEPYIDSTTMYIHYNFHHQAYVSNLNKALEKYPELYKKDIVELLQNIKELPADIQTAVRNNGGGFYNHNLFWKMMAPAGSTKMSAKLEKKLIENFGSIDNFKDEFEKAGMTRFGSGWAWLVIEHSGKLKIFSTPNQDSPVYQDAEVKGKPVLALDVWEHAYYLKYQNKRAAYVKAFWSVVNWAEVEMLLEK
jgi:Fe-Mn family superoxide dismutase